MQKTPVVAFFTIISRNYVSYYKAWRESVAKHHPEVKVFLILVDEPFDDYLRPDTVELIQAQEILGQDFEDMAVRYDVLEMNTAVKAESFRYIFEKYLPDHLVYFDPDIVLYSSIDDILKILSDGASAAVTPHVLEPLLDDRLPNDLHLLRSGTFNLGFLALARTAETDAFLSWWARRLRFQSYSAVTEGLFTDQKWCDLLPSFVQSLAIVRHPGANVAYWNVEQRPVSRSHDGAWLAGGRPLLFFHFSGFSIADPTIVSRHQDRVTWEDLGPAQSLFQQYKDRLLSFGWEDTRDISYAFGSLNGVPLSAPIRRLYARLFPKGLDPASIATLDVEEMCTKRDESVPHLGGVHISALAVQLFSMRPDIQAKFSIRTPWGRWRFRRWLRRHAAREYSIPKRLVRK